MTLGEIFAEVSAELKISGIPTCSLDAEIIICETAGIARHRIISHPETEISSDIIDSIHSITKRRTKREPLAYITGHKEFYGLEFSVNRSVLIPRPDTELLVDQAIYFAPQKSEFLDICTGSGAVAVSVKYNRPDLSVYASDISADALECARLNGEQIVSGKIEFTKSDVFSAFTGKKFSLITANPPYIAESEKNSLEAELSFEPEQALFADDSGMKIIKTIICNANEYLTDNGILLIEIGASQKNAVKDLAGLNGFEAVFCPDYSGIDRVARLSHKTGH
ncbi:MAG TPA: peptide chain release factor N(5)-glutamine methyltransferase [Spirochaetota bacterium]|nr:peptide chain release factor N(5)-glutamine methyltransferase [Spirochaetota bacterium]HQO21649.1 peptide chain release factor N(5)-glutamine methyltransferase [Spirochaetota bacterium]HQQ23294.1 peptide chain release factor N(5)-glutamine methyltransferase [Spirochaetota bacterium]